MDWNFSDLNFIDWNSNALWGIISVISGFLFSLLFYLIGKKQRKILFQGFLDPITNDDNYIINIFLNKYKNIKIDSLRKSTITIKNIGNTTIEKDDFSINSPLRIITKGKILSDYRDINKVLCKTNTINWTFKPLSEKDPSTLIIDFEYIPKKGEISFSIIHTDYIYIGGVLKEGKIIIQQTIKDIVINVIKDVLKYLIIPYAIGYLLRLIIMKILFYIF